MRRRQVGGGHRVGPLRQLLFQPQRPPGLAERDPVQEAEAAGIIAANGQQALGIRQAFDTSNANFNRIADLPPNDVLSISDVFHQTFVAVEEESTEAAAATAVTVAITPTINVGPADRVIIEVRVDRPFLFAIQHRASGACLFLGRVNDPR